MAPPVEIPDDATIIKGDNKPFYYKPWFWLLMLTSLALIVIAIIFEIYGTDIDNLNGIPFWVYAGFFIAIVAYLVAVVLYIIDIRKVTIVYNGNISATSAEPRSVFLDSNNQAIVTQRYASMNAATTNVVMNTQYSQPIIKSEPYAWYQPTVAQSTIQPITTDTRSTRLSSVTF